MNTTAKNHGNKVSFKSDQTKRWVDRFSDEEVAAHFSPDTGYTPYEQREVMQMYQDELMTELKAEMAAEIAMLKRCRVSLSDSYD